MFYGFLFFFVVHQAPYLALLDTTVKSVHCIRHFSTSSQIQLSHLALFSLFLFSPPRSLCVWVGGCPLSSLFSLLLGVVLFWMLFLFWFLLDGHVCMWVGLCLSVWVVGVHACVSICFGLFVYTSCEKPLPLIPLMCRHFLCWYREKLLEALWSWSSSSWEHSVRQGNDNSNVR